MFPFDVILFDVGGVLLTNGWDHGERAEAASQFGLDLAGLEARHAEVYPAWERGAMTGKDYLTHVIFNEPRSFSRGAFFSFMLGPVEAVAGWGDGNPEGSCGIEEVHGGCAEQRGAGDE